MMTNEIPMDALMALAAQRRERFTAEAEGFRLARMARCVKALRRRDRDRPDVRAGTRVTAAPRPSS